MSYSLPVDAATVSPSALKAAKQRLGKLRRKLDDCEVGDYCRCRPRPPGEFTLDGQRFTVAQTWVSSGWRTIPIIERIE
jgi:hypothetical protein